MQHLQSSWPTTYMFYKKQQKQMQSSPTHHRLWFPWRAPSAAIAPSSPEAITEQLSPQRYQDTCCGLLRGGDWHDDWHCHVNPGVAVSSDWFSRTLNHVHALPKLCEVSLETAMGRRWAQGDHSWRPPSLSAVAPIRNKWWPAWRCYFSVQFTWIFFVSKGFQWWTAVFLVKSLSPYSFNISI